MSYSTITCESALEDDGYSADDVADCMGCEDVTQTTTDQGGNETTEVLYSQCQEMAGLKFYDQDTNQQDVHPTYTPVQPGGGGFELIDDDEFKSCALQWGCKFECELTEIQMPSGDTEMGNACAIAFTDTIGFSLYGLGSNCPTRID